jgi:ketosteroid isomerase-like protein
MFSATVNGGVVRKDLLAAVVVGMLGVVPHARAQTAADSASVTAFYGAWFGSLRQGAETYATFYAADGMVLPPNAAPAVGRAAIAEWLRQSQTTVPYSVRPEGISVDEMRFLTATWVLYRSTLRGQRIPKSGGDPVAFETKYVDVLRRNETGRWEVAYRMWSDNR